jgi:polyribonucleotide nucleotidyltransferase
MPYGVFVDFSGKSGLLHVSEMSHTRIDNVEEVFKEGDPVKVKLVGVDKKTGKFRLSRKALMPRPPGHHDESDNDQDGGGYRGGRDDRRENRGGGGYRGGRDDRRRN